MSIPLMCTVAARVWYFSLFSLTFLSEIECGVPVVLPQAKPSRGPHRDVGVVIRYTCVAWHWNRGIHPYSQCLSNGTWSLVEDPCTCARSDSLGKKNKKKGEREREREREREIQTETDRDRQTETETERHSSSQPVSQTNRQADRDTQADVGT